MRNVLLRRQGGLGDLIMLSAAVKSFRDINPDTKVFLSTSPNYVNLFRGLPIYDDVFVDPPPINFDEIFELRGSVEAPQVGGTLPFDDYMKRNRIDIFESFLGVSQHSLPKHPMIRVNPLLIDKMKSKIDYHKGPFWVLIQTTCATPVRTPPPDLLIDLSKILKDKNVKIVYTGGEQWLPPQVVSWYNGGINLMNKLNLEEFVALVSIMDGMIAPDSSGPHVAAALNKKCIALFGNIDPYTRTHYYPTVKAIYPKGELACIPCGDNSFSGCHKIGLIGGYCLRQIDSVRIYKEMREWFGVEKGGEK